MIPFFATQQRKATACGGVATLQDVANLLKAVFAKVEIFQLFRSHVMRCDAMQNCITMDLEHMSSSICSVQKCSRNIQTGCRICKSAGQFANRLANLQIGQFRRLYGKISLSDPNKSSISGHCTALPRENHHHPVKVCQIYLYPHSESRNSCSSINRVVAFVSRCCVAENEVNNERLRASKSIYRFFPVAT